MSRRPRSPFGRASRYRLSVLRVSVTVARDWARRLGTPEQTLPPDAFEAIGDEALVLDSFAPALFYRARARAQRHVLLRMTAEEVERAETRYDELYEQKVFPERALARSNAAALADATIRLDELGSRVDELERARA